MRGNDKQVKCEACGIRIGEGFIEQALTQVTVRKAIPSGTGIRLTDRIVTLWVCSHCLGSTQRRATRYGVAYLTLPPSYEG